MSSYIFDSTPQNPPSPSNTQNVREFTIPSNNCWKWIVDNREYSLWSMIPSIISRFNCPQRIEPNTFFYSFGWKNDLKTEIPITCSQSTLDVGDFWIISPDERFLIIFERKTLEDWTASIKDGRYREQKVRLKAMQQKWIQDKNMTPIIIYLIEGRHLDDSHIFENNQLLVINNSRSSKIAGIPISTLWSSYFNLLLRDNMKIITCRNTEYSILTILKMMESLAKHYQEICDTYTNHLYESLTSPNDQVDGGDVETLYWNSIHLKKQKNLTPGIVYKNMLCQIPKVSKKTAQAIESVYPNMHSLFTAYEQIANVKERETMLSNITMAAEGDKDLVETGEAVVKKRGRTKKIGKELSRKIYKFLFMQGQGRGGEVEIEEMEEIEGDQ